MKHHVTLLFLATALVLATGAEARDPIANNPRLRPAVAADGTFVTTALQQSQVVREQVQKLDEGNVVVYVHLARAESGLAASAVRFVGRSKAQRFLMIRIGAALPFERQVALLGHELQHATEVANVPWVTCQADMKSLMAIVGWRDRSAAIGYETSAALAAERHVGREFGAPAKPRQ